MKNLPMRTRTCYLFLALPFAMRRSARRMPVRYCGLKRMEWETRSACLIEERWVSAKGFSEATQSTRSTDPYVRVYAYGSRRCES